MSSLITFNTYKLGKGGLLTSMSDVFNARVGDQNTPLVIQWRQGTTNTEIDLIKNKLHFFATGQVGNYLEQTDTGYTMSDDASFIEYEDTAGDFSLAHGITSVKLPAQFFPQEGIFYGYFGLKDDQGTQYTAVNVWFRVLGGIPLMGAAISHFSTRFDALVEKFEGNASDALAELRQGYQDEVKKNKDMSDETRAALSKLADAVGAIQAQIDAGNVVTRKDWKVTDNNATAANKLSLENKARIDQLTITPSGDGSTEIADVRVAPADDLFNAKTSKTAGESVRYQAETLEAELNSALEGHGLQNLLSLKKSDWTNLQLNADGTLTKGDYCLTSAFTAIKPLHYYRVSVASSYRFMINAYDKNKAFLYSTQGYTSNPYTFIADKNAAYVIVCVNANGTKMTQEDLPALKARLYEVDKFANDEFTYGTISSGKSIQNSVRVASDYIKLDYNSDYRIDSLYNTEIDCYDRNKNYLPNNVVNYFTGSKRMYTGYAIRYIRFIVKKTNADGTDIPMFDFSDVAPKITKIANNYIPRQLASLVWHVGGFDSDGSEKLDSSRMRSDPIRVNANTAYDISKPAEGYLVGVMLYDLDMNYITSYDYRSDKMTVEGFDGFIRLYLKKTTEAEFSSNSDGYAANITVTELNSGYLSLGKAGISLRIATNNVGGFGMGVQSGFSSNQHENMTLDQLSQNWLKYTSGIDILAMQEFSTYLDQAKTVSMRERLMNNFSVLKTGINNEALALKDGRLIDYEIGNLNGTQGWDTSGVRGYIKGTMRLNDGQNLSLYVVHFTAGSSDDGNQRRDEQKANLLKMLADDPSFIVFGDFNTPADDLMWKDFVGKYRVVNGTYLGTFGTYIYGDTSIDNIITSNNIVVKSAQVNPISDDNWVSTDHRMLIADVVVGESY